MYNFCKQLSLLLILGATYGCSVTTSAAQAADTSVLVLIEDSEADTLPASSSTSERVADAMIEQLGSADFATYDASVLAQSVMRRNHLNNTSLAALVRNNAREPGTDRTLPIDVVATTSLLVKSHQSGNSQTVIVGATGRLVDVNTGLLLATFDLPNVAGHLRLSRTCTESCLHERLWDEADNIGLLVGNEIAALLNDQHAITKEVDADTEGSVFGRMLSLSSTEYLAVKDYSLRIENISGAQYSELEEYLTDIFPGFHSLELAASTSSYYRVDYHSTISSSRLRRDLARAAEDLGWHASVMQDGNDLTFRRLSLRDTTPQDGTPVTESLRRKRQDFYAW
jgi:hypothetical protein